MVYVYYTNAEGEVCSVPVPGFGIDITTDDVKDLVRSVGGTLTGAGYDPIGDVE